MPLSDIRVVDCGQALAGPICATYLGDMGADVVKIERPGGEVFRNNRRERNGVPFNPAFEQFNRNKRSLCLNLKTEEGCDAVLQLTDMADVFVQNWPPGVAERLGVDYETLSKRNPDLVYVHVTGYGETGPLATKPAMDTIIQHISGLSSLMGYEGQPPIRCQSSVADYYAGCHAAISALGALRHRDKGKGGQKVSISLLESLMHNMDGAFEYYNNLDEVPRRAGRNAFFNPDMLYGGAAAADGWVCVALLLYSESMWEGFCDIVNRDDLRDDPQYRTDAGRLADAAELTAIFEEWLSKQSVETAVDTLNDAGIPAAAHRTIAEAAEMEHIAERDVFRTVQHPLLGEIELTNTPLSLSETPPNIDRHAPVLGEHNRDVLSELGYEEGDLARLEEAGIIPDD